MNIEMNASEATALYARTFSATTRHIINPAKPSHTLCGHRVSIPEIFRGDDGQMETAAGWMVRDLPPCERCEKSAAKRNIARG